MNRSVTFVIVLLAMSFPLAYAQSPGEWQKCKVDSDCTLIRGTCGPVPGNRQYVQQLQQKEAAIAAQIRADPKGPVQCATWADDPYANATVVCRQSANWCGLDYPNGKVPRLKSD